MFSENFEEDIMKKRNKNSKSEEVVEIVSPVSVVDEFEDAEPVVEEVSVFPEPEETVKEEETPEPPKAVVVDVDNLRIRTSPSADHNQNVKYMIPKGTEVVILGEPEGEFIHVAVKRELAPGIDMTDDGYAMLKFLKFI